MLHSSSALKPIRYATTTPPLGQTLMERLRGETTRSFCGARQGGYFVSIKSRCHRSSENTDTKNEE